MQLRLKCSADNSLCNKTVYLKQLCKQPFILMDINGNMKRILIEACNRAGFHPQISVVCNDIECYEKFIACNMGIGIGRQLEDAADATGGVGAKMFTIAGPVIVYGLAASVVYGFIYWLTTFL